MEELKQRWVTLMVTLYATQRHLESSESPLEQCLAETLCEQCGAFSMEFMKQLENNG